MNGDLSLSKKDIQILSLIKNTPLEKMSLETLYSRHKVSNKQLINVMGEGLIAHCDRVSIGNSNEAEDSYYRYTAVVITSKGKNALAEYLLRDNHKKKNRKHDFWMLAIGGVISALFSNLDRIINWIKTW